MSIPGIVLLEPYVAKDNRSGECKLQKKKKKEKRKKFKNPKPFVEAARGSLH